jgi:predicted transcriptional regulator
MPAISGEGFNMGVIVPQPLGSPKEQSLKKSGKTRHGRFKNEHPEDAAPPSIADLSRLELTCLNVLWHKSRATVREVRDALLPARPLAYTTVLTILGRMYAKNAIRRTKRGKTFLYEPTLDRQEACRQALRSMLDLYFDGSVERLQHLLRQSTVLAAASTQNWNEISEDLL